MQKKVIRIYILFTMQSCGLTCCCCPQVRNGGHYSVPARPSRWMWDKFKDDVHFYFMLVTSSLELDNEETKWLISSSCRPPSPWEPASSSPTCSTATPSSAPFPRTTIPRSGSTTQTPSPGDTKAPNPPTPLLYQYIGLNKKAPTPG